MSVQEPARSEEHTSELQSLMRISYAVFCLNKKNKLTLHNTSIHPHTILKRTKTKLVSRQLPKTHTEFHWLSLSRRCLLLHMVCASSLTCTILCYVVCVVCVFFNDTATTEIYTY